MNVIESIKNHEGFSATAYPDPITGSKPYTFGYGTTRISKHIAELQVKEDCDKIEKELNSKLLFYSNLPQNQKEVLVEMAYNIGIRGLLSFHNMLKALQGQHMPRVVEEMKNSRWFKQVPNRANDLIKKMQGI